MDNVKEKVASVGLAATLAATATVGNGLNVGEKDVLPETSYVQSIDGEDVNVEKNETVLASEVNDIGSTPVTSYDLPANDVINVFTDSSYISDVSNKPVSSDIVDTNIELDSVVNNVSNDENILNETVVNSETNENAVINDGGVSNNVSVVSEIDRVGVSKTQSLFNNSEYLDYISLHDTIGFAFDGYNHTHPSLSLSDALESTYGIELTDSQKARYDTLIQDTYDAYRKGVDAFENGDVDGFKKVCDEVLVDKKYMNLDDLVDIISININVNCGTNVIKNSRNYSMVDGKLIIDGYKVESLLNDASCNDFMNLFRLYNDLDDKEDLNSINMMQVPKQILVQAINPTSLSLMVNGTVYSYDDAKLKEKFDGINNNFCTNLGLNNLGFENTMNNDVLFFGYDENGNKQYIDINNPYAKQVSRFLVFSNYRKSPDGRIGYFDGAFMRAYFEEFDSLEKTVSK